MNLVPWIVVWAALAAVVIGLAAYRKVIAAHEDDSLHVNERETALVAQQEMLAKKLDWIDRWGQILTVIALIYGLALAGGYVYLSWIERNAPAVVGK